jgi:SMI1/KNR4 family protein SUKH-1
MKALPDSLVEYHSAGRPLEADLGEGFPGWLQLWPLSEIDERNKDYDVDRQAPGYTGIGSNGGGEMIALSPSGQVVVVPFIGMEPRVAIVVADSWETFESRIKFRSA